MDKKQMIKLINNLKTSDGKKMSVENLGKEYGKSKQAMYNYIQYYVDGEYTSIPTEICERFNEIVGRDEENEELVIEDTTQFRLAISILKEKIEDIDNEYPVYGKNESDRFKNNPEMEDFYNQLKEELKKLEYRFSDSIKKRMEISGDADLFPPKKVVIEPVDDMLRKAMKVGGYGGPKWNKTTNTDNYCGDLNTLCVADNGNYVVFADGILGDKGSTELHLYAMIAGERCRIANYKFNENESFVRFSLIPKLSYFYEVVNHSDGIFRFGIQVLKNYA